MSLLYRDRQAKQPPMVFNSATSNPKVSVQSTLALNFETKSWEKGSPVQWKGA